jgi:hypothetical protein
MSSQKAQSRLDKLKELQSYYKRSIVTGEFIKLMSLGLIGLAWILTIFFRFTLPFFFLHTIGTSLWLYYYVSTNKKIEQWKDLLIDPMFWFLLIITLVCGMYVVLAASRCSLSGVYY